MSTAPTVITHNNVKNFFANWGGHHTGTLVGDLRAGFVHWSWDALPETLAALEARGDVDQLVDDIGYSLRQCEDFRTADVEDLARASREFLSAWHAELTEALTTSLPN